MKILFIALITTTLLILIELLVCIYKYRKLLEKYNSLKRDGFKNNNKYSMIEYHIRNYKEGDNIFTTMRNIQNIIYNETIKDTYN